MDYSKLFTDTKKVSNTKPCDNQEFKILNYIKGVVDHGVVDHKVRVHYIIEFENTNKEVGIYETNDIIWKSLKNYLPIGSTIKASGHYFYDKNYNLNYIHINDFSYSNLLFSIKNGISSSIADYERDKDTIATFDLSTKKFIIRKKIPFFLVSLLLILSFINCFFYSDFALILWIINFGVGIIYTIIKNNNDTVKMKLMFEYHGLKKIKQPYLLISIQNQGLLGQDVHYNIKKIQ